MKSIELLAPAKNLACGIAAIDHGADAVYIGAQRFGARVAAGNSVEDIAALCRYAHQFGAKVYVTVNTIVYDGELSEMALLMQQLEEAGADAFLVQDLGIMDHAHIPLHASTQTDNRTVEKVSWLRSLGFRRVVLARELSAEEIAAIHRQVPDVELEVFVHGALCVSYSGVCYASEHCFGRSANRGACAQFCRLKFDLVDSDGYMIERQRYLLSLKDLCQVNHLEELLEAGAVSFKIEGRLKDEGYVKNVVSAYSQRLNAIIDRHPDRYQRASYGRSAYTFTPNLKKTFNRGFTSYFLHGRQPDIVSFDTPKAMGEYVGKVKEIRGNMFTVAGTASFANGDGLCFLNQYYELEGFRVNRADGNHLFPLKMPAHLRPGMGLYRNQDVAFEKLLAGKTAERKIPVVMCLSETAEGFQLCISIHTPTGVDSSKKKGVAVVSCEKQLAQKPQRENIIRQLTKLGNSPLTCHRLDIADDVDKYFIPSSLLSELRRKAADAFLAFDPATPAEHSRGESAPVLQARSTKGVGEGIASGSVFPFSSEHRRYPYLYNISNHQAAAFYQSQGMKQTAPAYEVGRDGGLKTSASSTMAKSTLTSGPLLMQCRHCLRYSLGYCVKHGGRRPSWREPLYLVLPDHRRFRLEFKCDECQMNVYAE